MSVLKPAVPSADEHVARNKVEALAKQLAETYLTEDPFALLDRELNVNGLAAWKAHDERDAETKGWSWEDQDALSEKLLAKTPLIMVNDRKTHIHPDYKVDAGGKPVPTGTETHARCVSVPLGLTQAVSIKAFAELRGLSPELADFQRTMRSSEVSSEVREQAEIEGLSRLAQEAGVVVSTYYYHDYDTAIDPIDYRVEGYNVYAPDGSIYRIAQTPAEEGTEEVRYVLEQIRSAEEQKA